jgi:hypothetical protein
MNFIIHARLKSFFIRYAEKTEFIHFFYNTLSATRKRYLFLLLFYSALHFYQLPLRTKIRFPRSG